MDFPKPFFIRLNGHSRRYVISKDGLYHFYPPAFRPSGTLVVLFRSILTNSFLTAETRSSQRRWCFFSGGERPPEKKSSQSLRGKGFMQISAGGREAAFYPTASHG